MPDKAALDKLVELPSPQVTRTGFAWKTSPVTRCATTMARNVEIKARIGDPARHAGLARQVSGEVGQTIEQEDFFFNCPHGRLKLRVFSTEKGELIHYVRPDRAGPKTSEYSIAGTSEPDALRRLLTRALGVRAVVRKTRRVYLAGRTRIHLDEVEGLGNFLEVEVVLDKSEDEAAGEREAARLMALLDVRPTDLVQGAYVDMIPADQDG